jgi:uncharacterized glyoxalase superfamily protein PhnB
MTSISDIKLWHSMAFRDADAMMRWLSEVGFVEHATYRDEEDASIVVHAEWVWPDAAAGLMFGSERPEAFTPQTGAATAYLVVDDVAAVFDRAVAAGASVLQPVTSQDYGGTSGSVADPEGNRWSFGDYQPS